MSNPIPDKSGNYMEKHWEDIIILLTLLSVAAVHYLIYSKIAFLDFFYLLVVLAGYYVGKRLAILGAFFCHYHGLGFYTARPNLLFWIRQLV